MQDGFVWVRHAITELELPELTRSVSIFPSVFYPDLRWAFCQQNGKGKGYLLAVMDWESRTWHLRRMDMEHTGGEVQITDRFGEISTAHRATGEFLFGKVHFPPVSPGSRRVSGRIHRSLSCDCSEMQIDGPHGDKYSADGAADRWHEARWSARKIVGEGRCPG